MSELSHARAIRNLATMFREMEAAANALETIGSVSQAVQDLEAKRVKVLGEVGEATENLAKLREEASGVLKAADDKAKRVISDAEAKAEEIITRSETEAGRKAAALVSEASEIVDRKKVEAEAQEIRLAEITTKVGLAQADLAALNSVAASTKETLESLRSEIQALRAKFQG